MVLWIRTPKFPQHPYVQGLFAPKMVSLRRSLVYHSTRDSDLSMLNDVKPFVHFCGYTSQQYKQLHTATRNSGTMAITVCEHVNNQHNRPTTKITTTSKRTRSRL